MELTHTFTLKDEHLEELKILQKAMQKASMSNGNSQEEAEKYYTLERVFDFVMQLGQDHMIFKQIENAAYYYDDFYEDYPYTYGASRTSEIMEKEKETGEYISHAYPNPRIRRER